MFVCLLSQSGYYLLTFIFIKFIITVGFVCVYVCGLFVHEIWWQGAGQGAGQGARLQLAGQLKE